MISTEHEDPMFDEHLIESFIHFIVGLLRSSDFVVSQSLCSVQFHLYSLVHACSVESELMSGTQTDLRSIYICHID